MSNSSKFKLILDVSSVNLFNGSKTSDLRLIMLSDLSALINNLPFPLFINADNIIISTFPELVGSLIWGLSWQFNTTEEVESIGKTSVVSGMINTT